MDYQGYTRPRDANEATVVVYIKLYHSLNPGPTSNGATYSARMTPFNRLVFFTRFFRVYGHLLHSRGQGESYPARRIKSKLNCLKWHLPYLLGPFFGRDMPIQSVLAPRMRPPVPLNRTLDHSEMGFNGSNAFYGLVY
jgi:hypothetical protein